MHESSTLAHSRPDNRASEAPARPRRAIRAAETARHAALTLVFKLRHYGDLHLVDFKALHDRLKRMIGNMRPELWLIRHGETQWSAAGRHTGRTDVALTEEGKRQASLLVDRLAGRPFSKVLSSPLSRAFETCRIAGYGSDAELTDDLR